MMQKVILFFGGACASIVVLVVVAALCGAFRVDPPINYAVHDYRFEITAAQERETAVLEREIERNSWSLCSD